VIDPIPTETDQPMRDAPFADALLALGARRDDVVVLSADLAKYTDVRPFADAYPDRFFQVGMAEANMMGIAGGLAKQGLLPIAVTYGVFATRRAYDQIAMALNTGPSRGIVVAFLPGITTPFRATHQAIDDLALMRAMPGMTVIDPMDATEFAAAAEGVAELPGSVYMRGLRGRVAEILPRDSYTYDLAGGVVALRDGGRVAVIGTGLGTQWALEAEARLDGLSLLHVPTLKPLDRDGILAFCAGFDEVTTVENHSIVGGLGSAVAEVLAEAGAATRLRRLGVPDTWAPAGTIDHIRRELGLDAEGLAAALTVKEPA
jgi:transketolase